VQMCFDEPPVIAYSCSFALLAWS